MRNAYQVWMWMHLNLGKGSGKMSQFEEGGFGYDLRCLMLQDQLNIMIP